MSYHHYRQPSLSPRAPHQQSGCSVCGYRQWFPFVIQHHKAMAVAMWRYVWSQPSNAIWVTHSFPVFLSMPLETPPASWPNAPSALIHRYAKFRSLLAPWKTQIYEWKELVGVEVVGVLTSIWTALRRCNYDYERVLKSLRQFSPCDWLWIGREAMVRRKSTLCLPGTLRVFVKWQDLSFRSRITSHYLELVVVYSSSF